MEEQSQVEELQKSLQEQGSNTEDVSPVLRQFLLSSVR